MAGVQALDFDSPDETRTPAKTRVDVVRTDGGATAARFTFEPGWKWSECVKPVVGTDSCQVHHVGFIQSGWRAPVLGYSGWPFRLEQTGGKPGLFQHRRFLRRGCRRQLARVRGG